ncbi:MAG: hypothetical protein WCK10_01275 [Candidatus Staskawiczbacteria bacterium]
MDINNPKIKEVRAVETIISGNLFAVCSVVTIITMFLMAVNFFARGSFLPTNIGFFYLVIVLTYSLHKEFLRWLGEKKSKHQGEYFVYAWIALTTILYVIDFFSNEYFDFSKEGFAISTVADTAYITIEVLVIFLATRVMKIFFLFQK